MKKIVKNITFAAMALMTVSCVENNIEGYINDGVIRYNLDNAAPIASKAAVETEELDPITLVSEDGEHTITLYRSVSRTMMDGAISSKAAPVKGTTIMDKYNDGSLQITAFNGENLYMPQQALVFVSQETGQTASLWKTESTFYWPDSQLKFWSWAPASESAADGKISGVAFNEDKSELSFTYTSPKSGDNNDAELQKDVLLAYDMASYSDNRNANLLYKHALSGICFKVDKADKCVVKSVSLSNVYGSAKCSFDGTNITWSDFSDATSFTETFNKVIETYQADDYANPQGLSTEEGNGDIDKTFLLVPQTATADKKVTLSMTVCFDGSPYDVILAAELNPADAIWEAGWTYTYSAEFDRQDYEFHLTNAEQEHLAYTNTTEPSDLTVVPVTSTVISSGVSSDAEWDIASYTINGVTTDVTDNKFADGGLTVVKDGMNINVKAFKRDSEGKGSNGYWLNTSGRTDNLGQSPVSWSDKGIIDLSKYNFQNESTNNAMTTANCYIIRHAGRYKLPLIYGNAVQNGSVHTETYYPNVTGGSNRLVKFLNHKGKQLSAVNDAFIENNDGCGGNDLKCAVIWQDCAQVLTNLCFSTDEVVPGTVYNVDNVRYLQFEVSDNTICQNNALVCVYMDNNSNGKYDDGEAVWSWHIWTTNDPALIGDPIKVINRTPCEYDFFPINSLGWIDPVEYPGRDAVTICLKQRSSNKIIEVIVKQDVVKERSNGTYYQFGRKDPIPRKELNELVSGSIFNKDGQGQVDIKTSICYPGTFYHAKSKAALSHDWCSTTYYNLWTGKQSTTTYDDDNANKIKTIYDPSPVGYKVPAPKAFTRFTTTGQSSTDKSQINAKGDFDNGWNLYCDEGMIQTIFFPTTGMRVGSSEPWDGSAMGLDIGGLYWSSVAAGVSNSYIIRFTETYFQIGAASDRATGYGVRPVKE